MLVLLNRGVKDEIFNLISFQFGQARKINDTTEKPQVHPAENIAGRQSRKQNRGQKPKKEPEPKAEKRTGAHGAPWGPSSFFGFRLWFFFRLSAPVLFSVVGKILILKGARRVIY